MLSCVQLFGSHELKPPGSFVHGISQAKILEWVVISFSRGSSQPRNWTCVSYIGRWTLLPESPQEVQSKHLLFSKYVIEYIRKAVSLQYCFCGKFCYSNCVFCFYFIFCQLKFFKVIGLFLQDFDNVYNLSIHLVLQSFKIGGKNPWFPHHGQEWKTLIYI